MTRQTMTPAILECTQSSFHAAIQIHAESMNLHAGLHEYLHEKQLHE